MYKSTHCNIQINIYSYRNYCQILDNPFFCSQFQSFDETLPDDTEILQDGVYIWHGGCHIVIHLHPAGVH